MKMFRICLPVICLMLMTGCGLDGPTPSKPKSDAVPPPSQSSEQKPLASEKAAPEKAAVHEAGPGKPTAEPKPDAVREKAAVGMGEKGRGYGGGVITTPIKAMWSAREKVFLDQMYHALDLYKADHDGHAPKTQDEFMQQIIKENHLQLPALPEGERYVYDPNTGELMVEKPKEP